MIGLAGCGDSGPPVGTIGHVTAYFGGAAAEEMQTKNEEVMEILQAVNEIPFGYILFNFAFYFLGGYLLYEHPHLRDEATHEMEEELASETRI